jgi:hypothetical protein
MTEGDLEKLEEKFQECRLEQSERVTQIEADVAALKRQNARFEVILTGPDGTTGLVRNMAELATSMNRLAMSLEQAVGILIPPDGTKGLVVRLGDLEKAMESRKLAEQKTHAEAREWRVWFYRALGASVITAGIGFLIALFK